MTIDERLDLAINLADKAVREDAPDADDLTCQAWHILRTIQAIRAGAPETATTIEAAANDDVWWGAWVHDPRAPIEDMVA